MQFWSQQDLQISEGLVCFFFLVSPLIISKREFAQSTWVRHRGTVEGSLVWLSCWLIAGRLRRCFWLSSSAWAQVRYLAHPMPKIIFRGSQAICITLHSVNSLTVAATGQWEAPVLQENSDDLLLLKLVLLQFRISGFLTKTGSSHTLVMSFVSVCNLHLLCLCACSAFL